MSEPDADAVVVGAGILGLAVARTLLLGTPAQSVVVVDKEPRVGAHQTSHNSGVIHSGVYYKPGSMKARFCVDGAARMRDYCKARGIPMSQGGKLIVAVADDEIQKLRELHRRAQANGARGLKWLERSMLHEVEPHVAGIAGLHVPETGVTDFGLVAESMAEEIKELSGELILGFEVQSISAEGETTAVLSTDGRTVTARKAVVCAGLQSDRLGAHQSGALSDIRIVPFRGSYFHLAPEARDLVRSMIYPVPDPRFPFLGVHFTRHIDGQVSCGPNAVLALSREHYRKWSFDLRDVWSTLSFRGSWRLAGRYAKAGFGEVARDLSRKKFLHDARRYMPELRAEHLQPGGLGVRAQAVSADGRLVDDFVIETQGPVTRVRNAPSPAATASLALADYITGVAESSD